MAADFEQAYPYDSFDPKFIENNNYHDWVVESWQRAANDVYPNVVEGQVISDEFDAKMKELCKKRVALAGYRLAYVIASIYP